jgi:hypothetical protein
MKSCLARFQEEVEWVRVNAERERIVKYKEIAQSSAVFYYQVLQRFIEESQAIKAEVTADLEGKQGEPQVIMEAYQEERQLKEFVTFITGKPRRLHAIDYMRFVIENGKHFTSDNFFMMLREIKAEYIDATAKRFLDILIDEL